MQELGYARSLHKEYNRIERISDKLRYFRRVAAYYDNSASSYMFFMPIVAIFFWLD